MVRWVIAIALSWSAWALEQPAVAHARPLSSELSAAMCGDGSQTVSRDDLALGRVLSLGAISASEDNPKRAAAAEADDTAPAWCISPDDPRCAPRDQSAPLDGPRAQVPVQDVTAMRFPELAAESGKDRLRSQPLGAARAGVALLIERPPRG